MRADPILEAFAFLTRRDPTAPLVASLGASASRGDVDALASDVAASLLALHLPAGSPVLVATANGAGFLAALLGCRRAGLVPALCDRDAPEDERARIVTTLGSPAEIACAGAFPRAPSDVRVVATGARPEPIDGAHYVKMTSGSSGEPSGVAVSAEALAADDEQLARTMGLAAADRILGAIPWSHSYGLSSVALPGLMRGSLLVLPEGGGPWAPLDAAKALDATVFPTVPIYLRTIATLAADGEWPASLDKVISAGALLPPDDAGRFRERFGRPAHVFYGATECGGITFDREGGAAERGTVGTPVEGVDIRLEGEDAPGEGTVVVSSRAVAISHVPRSQPSLEGGVFRSADLAASTPSGELRLLGRADALINVDGKKVQPGEVEAVLRALPGVREAIVLGVRAPESGRQIVRAVIARDPGRLTSDEVVAWCRPRLAPHKVPKSILLVDAIPRTARGKVDRAALSR